MIGLAGQLGRVVSLLLRLAGRHRAATVVSLVLALGWLAVMVPRAGAADPAYPDVVQSDSPSGYWRLGGDLTSVVGPAAESDGVTWNASGIPGSPASSVEIPAGSAMVGGSGFPAGSGGASLEFWYRSAAGGTTDGCRLGGTVSLGVVLNTSGVPTVSAYVEDPSFGPFLVGTSPVGVTTIRNEAWHHVVVTDDLSTFRLYVDGVLVKQSANAHPRIRQDHPVRVGRRWPVEGLPEPDPVTASTRGCVGSYDELATYDSALSDARVAAHYASGSVAPPEDPPPDEEEPPPAGSVCGLTEETACLVTVTNPGDQTCVGEQGEPCVVKLEQGQWTEVAAAAASLVFVGYVVMIYGWRRRT